MYDYVDYPCRRLKYPNRYTNAGDLRHLNTNKTLFNSHLLAIQEPILAD